MNPPKDLTGVVYNAIRVAPNGEVDVLDRDVDALLFEGWNLSADSLSEFLPKSVTELED